MPSFLKKRLSILNSKTNRRISNAVGAVMQPLESRTLLSGGTVTVINGPTLYVPGPPGGSPAGVTPINGFETTSNSQVTVNASPATIYIPGPSGGSPAGVTSINGFETTSNSQVTVNTSPAPIYIPGPPGGSPAGVTPINGFGTDPTGESSPIQAAAGQQFAGQVGFFPSEVDAQPQTLQLTIDWGDGTTSGGSLESITLPDGATATAVIGSHTYSRPGLFVVSVQANEDVGLGFDGIFGTLQSVADVSSSAGSSGLLIPATFGQEFTGAVGGFAAPSGGLPDDAQATINWGDGSSSAGQIVLQSDGSYQIVGSHVFQPNPYRGATIVLFSVQATVASATSGAPLATVNSVVELGDSQTYGVVNTVLTGQEFTGSVGTFPASLWTSSSLYQPGDYLQATIDWGDGTQSAGQLTLGSDGIYDVSGSHTYAQPGHQPILTSVEELDTVAGQSTPGHVYWPAVISSAFNVENADFYQAQSPASASPTPAAPLFTNARKTTFTIGSAGKFAITASGFPAAAIKESGALPTGVTFLDKGNGLAKLRGTPAAGMSGRYRITLTAHNSVKPRASQSFVLIVSAPVVAGPMLIANLAPSSIAINAPAVAEGSADSIILSGVGNDTLAGKF